MSLIIAQSIYTGPANRRPGGGRTNSIERAYKFLKEPETEHTRQREYEAMRRTVIFLLENAMGKGSSVSEEAIVKHLERRGLKMSVKHWQQNVLGYLREHVVFVGTWSRGVFLIVDEEDFRAAEAFLTNHIDTLQHRLAILQHQAVPSHQ